MESQKADFRIDFNGVWYHDGAKIERAALAKLFSDRALKIDEGGHYWLQTPYEKYPVEVEDVPYIVTDYEKVEDGFDMITNMGERVELSVKNLLELRLCKRLDQILPYIQIRNGLYARLSRSVYYHLIEHEGVEITSRKAVFQLGDGDE